MANDYFTPDEAARRAIDDDLRLDGEDPNSLFLDDAVHWVRVYTELLTFKEELVQRTDGHMEAMTEPDARHDAMTDAVLLGTQAKRYRRRLAEWRAKLDELTNAERAS